MKCAIIDDEPLALGLLESYVAKTPMLELCGKYASAVEAMGGLQSNPVDIIFLDIQMPDLNGLDFSKTIDTARTRIILQPHSANTLWRGIRSMHLTIC